MEISTGRLDSRTVLLTVGRLSYPIGRGELQSRRVTVSLSSNQSNKRLDSASPRSKSSRFAVVGAQAKRALRPSLDPQI